MPRKITRAEGRAAVSFVSDALADQFSMRGRPNAVDEGYRRFVRETGSRLDRIAFRQRVARAEQLFGMVPAAKARRRSSRKVSSDEAREIGGKLRGLLRNGSKTIAELVLRTQRSSREIEAGIAWLKDNGANVEKIGDRYDIPPMRRESYIEGKALEIVSRPDNTFSFAGIGDLHAGSKYTRWDVREDMVRLAEASGVQAILETGNWIEGEARFNRYDLEAVGLEQQIELLARKHPRTKLPIYAVTGDDHEGWYAQREGIDVGKYCANAMRVAGFDWRDLGYMEAHVTLRNYNSGMTSTLAVVHPGGGSSYALSYSIQKIVESYEGGEKPAVAFYGHYHKLWAGLIRNVWCIQTGCAQDQTPFMRKKRLEAHVGGTLVDLTQDPRTGAIISMRPELLRYFNRGYYPGNHRWSHSAPVHLPPRGRESIKHTYKRGA
jgi:hypothetical protein